MSSAKAIYIIAYTEVRLESYGGVLIKAFSYGFFVIRSDYMERKIVAIGGGKNGRVKSDGKREPYETEIIDKEIIKLTRKSNPNFLFLGHSQINPNSEKEYFETMKAIYGKIYGCECRTITRNELIKKDDEIPKIIDWADIIYEGGGNTLDMIKLWNETGFNHILENAWKNGKVMCGVSAGANCWFKECLSDSLKMKYGSDKPFIVMECLGFVNGLFVPHCDEKGRHEAVKELTKRSNIKSWQISNCAALEIIDNKYRIIADHSENRNIKGYGVKSYWINNKYFEEKIDSSDEFQLISEL